MKNFYFLILFLGMSSYSMEPFQNFILTNGGAKISIKPNFFRIDSSEKIIFYKTSNSEIVSKMSFKDFDYILIGKNKFKTYKLNNSKEVIGYFVLSETPSNTLILSSKSNDDESNLMYYALYVIDGKGNIIDNIQFDNLKKSKSAQVRADIFSKIKFYFGSCGQLIDRISLFDNRSLENFNLDILSFFDSPVYIECL